MVIHKFRLEMFDVVRHEMPGYPHPISVIEQNGEIMLYCTMDDPEQPVRDRYFGCFPTGDSDDFSGLKGRRTYGDCVGTVKVGVFVFHVFEVSA